MKLADLDSILVELAREDRIEVSGEIAEFSDIVRPRYSCGWKGGRRKGFLYGILGPTPSSQDPKNEHEYLLFYCGPAKNQLLGIAMGQSPGRLKVERRWL